MGILNIFLMIPDEILAKLKQEVQFDLFELMQVLNSLEIEAFLKTSHTCLQHRYLSDINRALFDLLQQFRLVCSNNLVNLVILQLLIDEIELVVERLIV